MADSRPLRYKPALKLTTKRYSPYKKREEDSYEKEARWLPDKLEDTAPDKLKKELCKPMTERKHLYAVEKELKVDEWDEPSKPWMSDAPRCPIHPQYGMCIKEVETKPGPA